MSSKSRERDPAKHENPRNESSISARSWRRPGKHEENTNKEQTARKERDATGMDEWMDGWMDETHQDTKPKKWMSFWARKSIQLLGFVFGEFF